MNGIRFVSNSHEPLPPFRQNGHIDPTLAMWMFQTRTSLFRHSDIVDQAGLPECSAVSNSHEPLPPFRPYTPDRLRRYRLCFKLARASSAIPTSLPTRHATSLMRMFQTRTSLFRHSDARCAQVALNINGSFKLARASSAIPTMPLPFVPLALMVGFKLARASSAIPTGFVYYVDPYYYVVSNSHEPLPPFRRTAGYRRRLFFHEFQTRTSLFRHSDVVVATKAQDKTLDRFQTRTSLFRHSDAA